MGLVWLAFPLPCRRSIRGVIHRIFLRLLPVQTNSSSSPVHSKLEPWARADRGDGPSHETDNIVLWNIPISVLDGLQSSNITNNKKKIPLLELCCESNRSTEAEHHQLARNSAPRETYQEETSDTQSFRIYIPNRSKGFMDMYQWPKNAKNQPKYLGRQELNKICHLN